ncbi:Uncharacterized protein SCF082_LOCUS41985 [Durusdinium trenchii]|uniref:Uncharacterized protein n=1 Tax=Durusdinium trenchii TaxID=1381693 RepID=A0ABP0QKY0_9DINO
MCLRPPRLAGCRDSARAWRLQRQNRGRGRDGGGQKGQRREGGVAQERAGGSRAGELQLVTKGRSEQQEQRMVAPPSKFDMMLNDAVRGFQLTDRAKAEIVHKQLVQFSEILKIKLRNKLFQYKFQALRTWEEIQDNGGQFFVPEGVQNVHWEMDSGDGRPAAPVASSAAHAGSPGVASAASFGMDGVRQLGGAMSLVMPQSMGGRLATGVVAVLTFGSLYRRMVQDMRPFLVMMAGYNVYRIASLKLQAQELQQYLNVLLAFEENGEDELENERVVREVAEQVALRHINHISKLSKTGQKTFASVIVDRICRHLSRHRFGFEEESIVWYVRDFQQMMWSMEMFFKRMTLPADRVTMRPRLNLQARVVRALTAESSENDDRILELEPFHNEVDPIEQPFPWTASGVLSKSAVFVHEHDCVYVHSQTDVALYGIAYGSAQEVKWSAAEARGPAARAVVLEVLDLVGA